MQRIADILKEQGDLYTVDDVFAAVQRGEYQSFSDGDSLVVTSVRQFPRRKALEIILAVGTLEQIYAIQPRVVAFARDNGCEVMLASVGRDGWFGVKTPGWERVASTYLRRL